MVISKLFYTVIPRYNHFLLVSITVVFSYSSYVHLMIEYLLKEICYILSVGAFESHSFKEVCSIFSGTMIHNLPLT